MDPPASFSSLPPELVLKICSDPSLKKKDLTALRRTSKAQGIHASATKAFGKLCFTTVPLLYNKFSLETFVKICQHRTFGACVRNAQLSCARMDPAFFHDILRDIASYDWSGKTVMREAKRLAARCDSAETFVTDVAQSLLDQAFHQLAMSNHELTITVSTEESGSLGYRKTFVLEPECDYFYADIPATVGHLLRSATRTGCKVPVVNIMGLARTFKNGSALDLADLFHSISELSLELSFIMDYDEPGPRDFIRWMRNTLSKCHSLESLNISLDLSELDNLRNLDEFTESISHISLEVLRLFNMGINQRTMINLMVALGPTLRRLVMNGCWMIGRGKEILVAIQQHAIHLDYLELDGTKWFWVEGKIICEGSSAVREGLEKMLRTYEVPNDGSNEE